MFEILKFVYVMIFFISLFYFLNGVIAGKPLLSSFSNNFLYYTLFLSYFVDIPIIMFYITGDYYSCHYDGQCDEDCPFPFKGYCVDQLCLCKRWLQ